MTISTNNNIFYMVSFLFCASIYSEQKTDWGQKCGEGIGNGIGAGLKTASEAIAEGIENASPLLGEKAAEILGKDVIKAVEKITPFCNDISFYFQIVSLVYTSGKIINMGTHFYTNVFPTDEQKLEKALISKQLKMLTAQSDFRQCLGNNAVSKKNDAGYPYKCEDIARKIIELDSSSDDFIKKTIAAFKEFHPDYIKNK